MPHSITAEFSLNTPLFSSGADPNSPELRVSEIKAALRFWWRAMNYSLYVADRSRFVDTESQLFGSANASQGQGVLVSLINVDGLSEKVCTGVEYTDFQDHPGARYLGYGLMGHTAVLKRSCIEPGGTFKIRLNWRDETARARVHKAATLKHVDFQAHMIQALKTFGTFGGLGSRSRRGYGSVTLQSLKNADGTDWPDWTVPKDSAELKEEVTELLKVQRKAVHTVPDDIKYSAFTCLSRCTVFSLAGAAHSTPYPVLNAMGSAFVRYRAWGNGGKILSGATSNQIFQADHDWFKNPSALPSSFTHPHRIVFGLPLPYSQTDIWGGHETRRASPLFFHIHKASQNLYFGLMFDLRSEFLAPGTAGAPATIAVPNSTSNVPVTPDWSMLDELHDGAIPTTGSTRSRTSLISLTPGMTLTKIF